MLASRYIKREKASLVVDLRRSKTSLLNLPISSQTRGLGAELYKCYRSAFSQVKLLLLRQTLGSTQLASVHFVSSTRWVAGLKKNTGLIKLCRLATINMKT